MYTLSPEFREEAIDALVDQSDSVVMDSLARGNEARPVAVHCDSLEVWDTEKARLLKL